MNTFEYKVIRIPHNNSFVDFSEVLNGQGQEGWEVVSVDASAIRHNFTVVLKRSIVPNEKLAPKVIKKPKA